MPDLQTALNATLYPVPPPQQQQQQHGLSPKEMALVTSNCGTTRSMSIKWP